MEFVGGSAARVSAPVSRLKPPCTPCAGEPSGRRKDKQGSTSPAGAGAALCGRRPPRFPAGAHNPGGRSMTLSSVARNGRCCSPCWSSHCRRVQPPMSTRASTAPARATVSTYGSLTVRSTSSTRTRLAEPLHGLQPRLGLPRRGEVVGCLVGREQATARPSARCLSLTSPGFTFIQKSQDNWFPLPGRRKRVDSLGYTGPDGLRCQHRKPERRHLQPGRLQLESCTTTPSSTPRRRR